MNKLRLIGFGLAFLWLITIRPAAQPPFAPLSVAEPGGFWSPWTNPAGLCAGDAEGAALVIDYRDAARAGDVTRLAEDFSLFLNLSWIGYSYREQDGARWHDLALAGRVARNLSIGGALRAETAGSREVDLVLAGLFRPLDTLSLGGVLTMPLASAASLRLGLGLRPFAFHPYLGDRLTLTADLAWSGVRWEKPLLALRTELIDGLRLDAAYDLQRAVFSAGLGLTLDHLSTGSLLSLAAKGRTAGGPFEDGLAWLHLSPRRFRPTQFGQALGPRFSPARDHFVDYHPGPRIVEQESGMSVGPFWLVSGDPTFREVVDEIGRLAREPSVSGILFRNHRLQASFADLLEVEAALHAFKAAGKKVVFYCELADNLNYALAAAAADRLYLHPQGMVDLRGFSISTPYLRNLFDSMGVEVENLRSHPFKSAYNFLSESAMTDAEREANATYLQGTYGHLLAMIREGRAARIARPVEQLVDEGPYLQASEALAAGLVDELLYEDQLPQRLKELAALPAPPRKVIRPAEEDLAETVRYDWSDPPEDRVALIVASGPIQRGEAAAGVAVGSQSLARCIRQAREDRSIRGILLRVDSPGGSALAADVIAREVTLCREGENAKPVVVSMGGVAASGGYYIAAPAARIVAQPVTLTGSIGVVSLSANLEKLFENLLIHWGTVKTGEHADMGSLVRELTPEEREKIRAEVQSSYERFLDTVARGRGLDRETVHRAAQGRIWTGEQAKERGLLDEIGGLQTSVQVMRGLLHSGRPIRLVSRPQRGIRLKVGGTLPRLFGGAAVQEPIPISELQSLVDLYREYSRYREERILMILPLRVDF